MSCHRAHRVSVQRLVVVSRDPLAPDTDLHHRMIRECLVDCRTDGTSGRDEKDVGVRSCSCGVAEKKSGARMAHGDRGENSREIRSPILFGMARYQGCAVQEWYYCPPEMSSNKLNGRLPRTYCPARAAGYFSRMTEQLTDPLPELERAVAERPDDAQALVALANHYWLIGAGPEAVGDLASRAIASDGDNRAAWHLWALAESNPRERVSRWQQVSARFPLDELAKANLADNAASLAGAEHDYQAVDLAIETYEDLLATATHPGQRTALEKAIKTLKGWKF